MVPGDRKPLLFPFLVGFLLLAIFCQSFFASRIKSPAWDETGDIAAGLSYWGTGKFTVNPQHPPLLKELSGLSMLIGGIRWPGSAEAERLLAGDARLQWAVGNEIIIRHGRDHTLFWARLPFIMLTTLLGLLVYWWGRRIVGASAALGALFLYALDPNVLAHSYLVTMDLGFAAFTVLFFFALWLYVELPTNPRLVFCGVALGAVLAAKFSALLLLPVAGLLLLAAVWRPPAKLSAAHRPWINLYGFSLLATAKAGPNDPCPCGSGRKFKKCHGPSERKPAAGMASTRPFLLAAAALALMSLLAMIVIYALYFFPSDPTIYFKGLGLVNRDHDPNYPAYLAGSLDRHFFSYFAVAWFLKEPLATVILTILGTALVLCSKSLPLLAKLFLLLPPAALFAAHTLLADALGIRYLLPALPFAYLAGGVALAEWIESRVMWKQAAAAILCAWVAVAAVGIFPDHLSYFNESACLLSDPGQIGWDGGSRCGTYWLDDSNVDWGEGLGQLRSWVDRYARQRAIKISYFGSFPPESYGFKGPTLQLNELFAEPPPGLYAVSAHMLARAAIYTKYQSGQVSWLRSRRPLALIGHCFYIYDVK